MKKCPQRKNAMVLRTIERERGKKKKEKDYFKTSGWETRKRKNFTSRVDRIFCVFGKSEAEHREKSSVAEQEEKEEKRKKKKRTNILTTTEGKISQLNGKMMMTTETQGAL